MSIQDNNNGNNLASAISRERNRNETPMHTQIASGIYRAITTGIPDPEGRGRLSAYVPKLGGEPDNPLFFQYATPFGGGGVQGSYGMFATPPDAGITVMVFFAENGEVSEGYWFAVAQEVPDVLSGGPSGQAQVDGTGQGSGAFSDQPSAKSIPNSLEEFRNPSDATDARDSDRRNDPNANRVQPTTQEIQNVERLNGSGALNDSNAYNKLTPGERTYAVERGYVQKPVEDNNATESNTTSDEVASREQQITNHPRNITTSNQGIYTDPVRGQSTATPTRNASYETPEHSSVFGFKTPGSNALTMDDGSVAPDGTVHPNQIRLQTGGGASVILDGTNDTIYMINSTGSGWVEIGAQGEIMAYAQGSISMRAEKDVNIRADNNINFEAGKNVNIKSGINYSVEAGNQVRVKSNGTQMFDSGGYTHIKVAASLIATSGNEIHLNGPQAASIPTMSTTSHPDIQNLSSTIVNDSITSTMPSHEPMTRGNPGIANTLPGGGIENDPTSAEGQAESTGQDGPPPELSDTEGLATVRSKTGVSTQVAAVFQSNFQGLIDDLDSMGYEIKQLGGYVNRNARGSSRPSYHAMGAAIDINWNQNGYAANRPSGWNPGTSRAPDYKCDLPLNISEIAARHGLGWGGNWSRPWDPMHFSAGSGERGAYRFSRNYNVVASADITGTTSVRQA